MAVPKKPNERYFLVFYVADYFESDITGNVQVTTLDGRYIGRDETCSQIEEKFGCTQVCLTNVIEMSERDYLDWEG